MERDNVERDNVDEDTIDEDNVDESTEQTEKSELILLSHVVSEYTPVLNADTITLEELLSQDLKYSEPWWELNTYWISAYHYSLRVQLIFDFIENLIIPSGKGKGTPVTLEPFEKDFIKDIYNPVDANWSRIVLRAILSMGRKNGKTFIVACLVLVHLIGPEATTNGEIYSAATERDQAAIVFKYAEQIVRADEELSQWIRIVDSTKTMVCFNNGSFYRAVSAEAGTKMGYNPTFVVYDELAQAKNEALYEAFDTSMGARLEAGEEPLFVVISTQSKDPQHILSRLITDGCKNEDPTTICHLYMVPMPGNDEDDDALTNESKWFLANPALGNFRSLVELRTFAKKAIRMPSFENSFRNLYLNQCVDARSPFIPRAEWMACKGDATIPLGSEIYLALDLSGKIDLTALVGTNADGEECRIMSRFWKPQETLSEHERRDGVPYTLWAKQGHILTTPGRAVQYSFIAKELAKVHKDYVIVGLAFDRYRIDDLMNALDAIGVDCYVEGKDKELAGGMRLVPWGQGYASMTQAVEALEDVVLNRQLVHDMHPCLNWNISNAMTIEDAAGNRKLNKAATRFRIDGAVSLAMCIGLKGRDRKNEIAPSAYEGMTKEEILEAMSL